MTYLRIQTLGNVRFSHICSSNLKIYNILHMLLTQLFCVFTGDIAGVCSNICIIHNIVCICVRECILKVRVCVGVWVGGRDNVCDCLC